MPIFFEHLSSGCHLLCSLFFFLQGASNVSPLKPSHRSAILNILNYHCRCIVTCIYSLRIANWLKILNQAVSIRCSGDNKETLSTKIRSEYASDFCHDRESALTRKQNLLDAGIFCMGFFISWVQHIILLTCHQLWPFFKL